MMWDEVVIAWVALLLADTDLTAVIGANVNPVGASRPVAIPSVEYSIASDTETELFNPIVVQVDVFARGTAQARTIERRIRLITHRDVAREIGTHRMWTRYLDSRSHQYPDPGVVHRSLDFLFEPLRAKYALLVSES